MDQRDNYSEEAFTADRNNEVQMGMTGLFLSIQRAYEN